MTLRHFIQIVENSLKGERAGVEYPLASRDEWYGNSDFAARGGRLVTMTPDNYLSRVRDRW